ncbi:MAG: GAF domain-containing sensor histidine kinase [Anaerolineae bacterium]|nr:GAF domain-containing sensor histidine kinase [Anaerolineae bacterium]
MYKVFISENNTLRETLIATLRAAGTTVETLSDLGKLQVRLDEEMTEVQLVALPLGEQEALLLPQLLAKAAPQLPVIVLSTTPATPEWDLCSSCPYVQPDSESMDMLPAPRSRKKLLEAITTLTPTLFTEFELESLLQRIIEEAVALIPGATAGSLLLDEGANFAFRAFVGYPPELHQVKIPPASSFIPRLRQGEIVHIHNIANTNTNDFPEQVSEELMRYGRVREIRETLAAPLLRGELMIGYITVDSFEPGTQFTDGDKEALSYLASIATIAIHNAQLLNAERTARTLAETLGELGQQLVASLEVNEVLAQVLNALFRLTPCDAADILLTHNEDVILVQRRTLGDFPRPPANFRLELQHTTNLWQAAQQRSPLLITDTAQAPGWVYSPETAWIRSHIAAPFFLNQELAGFLCVSGARVQQFSRADSETLAALIPLVTIALHNAGLFQEALSARERAETAYEDLRRLDAMKSQFIQNVSHELRTPLAIVKGYLDLVLDASFGFKLEPNMEQALKAMQTHTNRLTSLVESITTLENVETGQLERTPQPILPVFMRALQAVRQKAERNHIEMIIELDQQLPQVNLDPQQLGLALWHLLDNAIKFNRPGGRVWVNAQQQANEIICSIRDEGIGIPLSEQVRIFERFYQVDGSTKRRYEGMGLGLSITREVVEKHGGHIWVHSDGIDTGTTFTITLPVYYEDTQA